MARLCKVGNAGTAQQAGAANGQTDDFYIVTTQSLRTQFDEKPAVDTLVFEYDHLAVSRSRFRLEEVAVETVGHFFESCFRGQAGSRHPAR
jgi:hypothetical protein